ncbi:MULTISPECIES: hypothetical protein [Deefgea]|uniref:Alkaline phytoceramidase n=1 Tax=Deefgea chitinilytica TaxID=570276 RepID=A0ABS2CC68_9NEIS|nr:MULTISPECIES: hypothetical protein [Deefgea]MBM5571744.1 hypothetical protein [Deefgea chitinilytica]MBM9888979.1 hypothetical protein [Deefgea sp. CFH1-16]
MQKLITLFIVLALTIGMAINGPIAQLEGYHSFADTVMRFGIVNCGDVCSNLGFALVAVWGVFYLWPRRAQLNLGFTLFVLAIFLTAIGSSYYHWMPNDERLVWDRIPISLACAGLLAGVWQDFSPQKNQWPLVIALSIFAIVGVVYWYYSGDLRLYLALQILPLVLIPAWQWHAPKAERLTFAAAIALYVLAKIAELADYQIYALLGFMSGHTLKHLLATLAAGVIIYHLVQRTRKHRNG